MNLVNLIRTLDKQDHDKIGEAVSYDDIFNALKVKGFDNKHILDAELIKLYDDGIVELLFENDLICAVKIK